jgi:tetratricopeptide (TPR) repeat protein
MFTGPRAVLRAWALELLARPEQARAEWQNAVRVADRELEEFPGEAKARYWKAWALTRLDQKAEAESLLRLLEEDPAALQSLNLATGGLVGLQIQLGQFDRALEALDANDRRAGPIPRRITKAQLALLPSPHGRRAGAGREKGNEADYSDARRARGQRKIPRRPPA